MPQDKMINQIYSLLALPDENNPEDSVVVEIKCRLAERLAAMGELYAIRVIWSGLRDQLIGALSAKETDPDRRHALLSLREDFQHFARVTDPKLDINNHKQAILENYRELQTALSTGKVGRAIGEAEFQLIVDTSVELSVLELGDKWKEAPPASVKDCEGFQAAWEGLVNQAVQNAKHNLEAKKQLLTIESSRVIWSPKVADAISTAFAEDQEKTEQQLQDVIKEHASVELKLNQINQEIATLAPLLVRSPQKSPSAINSAKQLSLLYIDRNKLQLELQDLAEHKQLLENNKDALTGKTSPPAFKVELGGDQSNLEEVNMALIHAEKHYRDLPNNVAESVRQEAGKAWVVAFNAQKLKQLLDRQAAQRQDAERSSTPRHIAVTKLYSCVYSYNDAEQLHTNTSEGLKLAEAELTLRKMQLKGGKISVRSDETCKTLNKEIAALKKTLTLATKTMMDDDRLFAEELALSKDPIDPSRIQAAVIGAHKGAVLARKRAVLKDDRSKALALTEERLKEVKERLKKVNVKIEQLAQFQTEDWSTKMLNPPIENLSQTTQSVTSDEMLRQGTPTDTVRSVKDRDDEDSNNEATYLDIDHVSPLSPERDRQESSFFAQLQFLAESALVAPQPHLEIVPHIERMHRKKVAYSVANYAKTEATQHLEVATFLLEKKRSQLGIFSRKDKAFRQLETQVKEWRTRLAAAEKDMRAAEKAMGVEIDAVKKTNQALIEQGNEPIRWSDFQVAVVEGLAKAVDDALSQRPVHPIQLDRSSKDDLPVGLSQLLGKVEEAGSKIIPSRSRHPERSEGSPETGIEPMQRRSLATLGMTEERGMTEELGMTGDPRRMKDSYHRAVQGLNEGIQHYEQLNKMLSDKATRQLLDQAKQPMPEKLVLLHCQDGVDDVIKTASQQYAAAYTTLEQLKTGYVTAYDRAQKVQEGLNEDLIEFPTDDALKQAMITHENERKAYQYLLKGFKQQIAVDWNESPHEFLESAYKNRQLKPADQRVVCPAVVAKPVEGMIRATADYAMATQQQDDAVAHLNLIALLLDANAKALKKAWDGKGVARGQLEWQKQHWLKQLKQADKRMDKAERSLTAEREKIAKISKQEVKKGNAPISKTSVENAVKAGLKAGMIEAERYQVQKDNPPAVFFGLLEGKRINKLKSDLSEAENAVQRERQAFLKNPQTLDELEKAKMKRQGLLEETQEYLTAYMQTLEPSQAEPWTKLSEYFEPTSGAGTSGGVQNVPEKMQEKIQSLSELIFDYQAIREEKVALSLKLGYLVERISAGERPLGFFAKRRDTGLKTLRFDKAACEAQLKVLAERVALTEQVLTSEQQVLDAMNEALVVKGEVPISRSDIEKMVMDGVDNLSNAMKENEVLERYQRAIQNIIEVNGELSELSRSNEPDAALLEYPTQEQFLNQSFERRLEIVSTLERMVDQYMNEIDAHYDRGMEWSEDDLLLLAAKELVAKVNESYPQKVMKQATSLKAELDSDDQSMDKIKTMVDELRTAVADAELIQRASGPSGM
ncbi:MAG: hypothetical protein NTW08_08340 [Gammaproteobacteria bacterium]|nr:hypothetical protein [Gammaproteobacteria bacterium]